MSQINLSISLPECIVNQIDKLIDAGHFFTREDAITYMLRLYFDTFSKPNTSCKL